MKEMEELDVHYGEAVLFALLFADDTKLITRSKEELQHILNRVI